MNVSRAYVCVQKENLFTTTMFRDIGKTAARRTDVVTPDNYKAKRQIEGESVKTEVKRQETIVGYSANLQRYSAARRAYK